MDESRRRGGKRMGLRVPFEGLLAELRRVLLKLGFEPERAETCARLFAEASRDGVYSHGLNRFPVFVRMVQSGVVDLHARPRLVEARGALERWDGMRGPGNLNAWQCMARAVELSHTHGIACVALANTNHWMRGGSYGWQAAEAGRVGVCWTNTLPNLPPWGASRPRLGNNPLVVAVPRASGHVVLDMAMSQFSFGALASYRRSGRELPVEGGFDSEGRLTRDPAAIEASMRPLPIGYWKGSGLSLVLDMMAALLSGGRATHQIEPELERETGLSQVFIALAPPGGEGFADELADEIIEHLKGDGGEPVRYPGERTLATRRENLERGVPVEPSLWQKVREM
ncbi:MAG TPA: 3-dehydro-L-gulonate 2-dehydrogenase [Pyrinomonadaceae bacterium]|nr:3-dehydro-L-gulonate 2-dehydrogenase [Pyrinomonadaceae bacterium]